MMCCHFPQVFSDWKNVAEPLMPWSADVEENALDLAIRLGKTNMGEHDEDERASWDDSSSM